MRRLRPVAMAVAAWRPTTAPPSGSPRPRTLTTLARGTAVPSPSCVGPWLQRPRYATEAAIDEKKFHCSVCKKGFRLRLSAEVHVQQRHPGENGSVVDGAPEDVPEAAAAPEPPKEAPTPPPTPAPPVASGPKTSLKKAAWVPPEERDAPGPMTRPVFDLPPEALTILHGMWDEFGSKKVTDGSFMASWDVANVQATAGYASTTLSKPTVEIKDQGINPFAAAGGATDAADAAAPIAVATPSPPTEGVSVRPAATAAADGCPFAPASLASEFVPAVTKQPVKFPREGVDYAAAMASATMSTPAPAAATGTPATAATPTPTTSAATTATPAVTGTAPPPPPPPRVKTGSGLGVDSESNGAGAAAAAPVAAGPPSPFDDAHYMPYQEGDPDVMEKATALASKAAVEAAKKADAEELAGGIREKKFTCTSCGRAFSTQAGLMTHYMSKHDMSGAAAQMKVSGGEGAASDAPAAPGAQIPDLPTFIPTPIDMSAMAPQHVSEMNPAEVVAWRDVTLVPSAATYANMHIMGAVVSIRVMEKQPVVELRVRYSAEEPSESIVVRCHGESTKAFITDNQFAEGTLVAVHGSLRVVFRDDPISGRPMSVAEVVVAPPLGSLHLL